MPRPRVLPFIILGLLNKNGSMSGRDMIKEFKNEISEFWSVSHSQLYPELQRMLEEGDIEVRKGSSNLKVINYQITKNGIEKLNQWFSESINLKNDDLTSVKLYCIVDRHSPLLSEIFEKEFDLHNQKLKHLKERRQMLFQNQEQINNEYGYYLILTRAIRREKAYLDWLKMNKSKKNR